MFRPIRGLILLALGFALGFVFNALQGCGDTVPAAHADTIDTTPPACAGGPVPVVLEDDYDADYEADYRRTNEFDDRGRLRRTHHDFEADGDIDEVTEYEYDADGCLFRIYTDGGQGEPPDGRFDHITTQYWTVQ